MTAVWDEATFGAAPEFAGYSERPRSNLVVSQAAIGNGKRRRRHSGTEFRLISFAYTWSFATYRSFRTWYQVDLNEGATQFTMTDRVMNVTGTFEIDPDEPYTTDPVGRGHLKVTINATRVS